MSKTIEQLRQQAAQIEEATRQGENTQLRVGGLFMDVIDFIGQIPINETVLGPLLQALNNSRLIDPSQALVFSVLKDGWTFTDAFTQLKIGLNQISSTVASNYEAFVRVKDQLEAEVAATDQRVREYKTDYDNSQIEYATWKSQTDTSISQYAVAIDKVSGDIISISGRVDTAYDQLDFVTNNLDAADKALEKLFNLTGLDYEDPEEAYTASWLYKNRQGIYGAAATFDASGNIIQSSVLGVTTRGIQADINNVDGRCTTIQANVDGITTRVTNIEGTYSSIIQEATRISNEVHLLDGRVGKIEIAEEKFVDAEGVERIIRAANIQADKIDFTDMTIGWTVKNGDGDVVFSLESNGNLMISGEFDGKIKNQVEISGTGPNANNKLFIRPNGENGAELVGYVGSYQVINLGFSTHESFKHPSFVLKTDTFNRERRLSMYPDEIEIKHGSFSRAIFGNMGIPEMYLEENATGYYHCTLQLGKMHIGCSNVSMWPTSTSDVSVGEIFVDHNGFLCVKRNN